MPFLPVFNFFISTYLIISLKVETWIRLAVWLVIGRKMSIKLIMQLYLPLSCNSLKFSFLTGLIIYLGYGIRNSKEAKTSTNPSATYYQLKEDQSNTVECFTATEHSD